MELKHGQCKEGELGNATRSRKRVPRPAGTRIWVCLKRHIKNTWWAEEMLHVIWLVGHLPGKRMQWPPDMSTPSCSAGSDWWRRNLLVPKCSFQSCVCVCVCVCVCLKIRLGSLSTEYLSISLWLLPFLLWLDIVKMSILPTPVYRFNPIPYQNPNDIFHKNGKF